ncbi:SPOSA6832_02556, partial [Sporobolomyces salmonicolor]
MTLEATINCDCGESFGQWSLGDDEGLFPIVDIANLACGFHGGDFDVMRKTVELAKKHNVGIGSHPSLPDQQGFGRRVMVMEPASFFNAILYQQGALTAYLKLAGIQQTHIKPHGQVKRFSLAHAYIMSSKDIDLARQSAKVAKLYDLPLLGLPGSAHEEACKEEGVEFIAGGLPFLLPLPHHVVAYLSLPTEWYADLQYSDDAKLLPPASAAHRTPITGEQTRGMLETSTWLSLAGQTCKFPEGTKKISICVHGDFPGAVEVAKAVRRAIDDVKNGVPAQ